MHEWDEAKRTSNLAKHGVDFTAAAELDWDTVIEDEDRRRCYGEPRWRALGVIDGRVHLMICTRRLGRVRIISLRLANQRERRVYDEATQDLPDR